MDLNNLDYVLKEKMLFVKKFVADPRSIGSIAPSSSFLTESILCNVGWDSIKVIAELGAGTGVFTRQIIERMEAGSDLLIFELEPELRARLQSETGRRVFSDAAKLPQIMKSEGLDGVDLIISSLPYAVLPKNITNSIIQGIVSSMRPDGTFLAYQYSLQMKGDLEKIFSNICVRFVPLNIPPAFVYECTGLIK